jgi:hypothetical protein
MTVIAVCSAKGAPGATTTALALALAWPLNAGSVLLVDADPAGADLASGYLQGATGPSAGAGAVATARGDLLDAVHGSAFALDATGSRLLLAGPAPFPPTRPGAAPACGPGRIAAGGRRPRGARDRVVVARGRGSTPRRNYASCSRAGTLVVAARVAAGRR